MKLNLTETSFYKLWKPTCWQLRTVWHNKLMLTVVTSHLL